MNTFQMTSDFRNQLAQKEMERQAVVNKWEHRAGQVCFAIMALALILKYAGVL
jgi:hypothetical protein